MSFNLEKYIKGSAKDAFSRMTEEASNQVRDAAINSVTKTFGNALKKIGFSNKIVSSVTSKMADAAQAELAEKFFKKANPEINRVPTVSGEGVKQNRVREIQETTAEVDRKIGGGYDDVDGGRKNWVGYPSERGRYYTKIEFSKYLRLNAHDNAKAEVIQTIFLPLPDRLQEMFNLNLTGSNQGVAGAIGDLISKGEMNLSDAAGVSAPLALDAVSKLADKVISGSGDPIKTFVQQAYGFTPNPHLSVLFEGVNLREHTFSWKAYPESPQESADLAEILRKIKFYSLPLFFQDTSALFDYPAMCKITFWAEKDQLAYLYDTKYCLVKNVGINYAPNGVPSFFAGTDAPTAIVFELQLQEIEYFTAESFGTEQDYKNRPERAILPVVEKLNSILGGEGEGGPAATDNITNRIQNGPWTESDIGPAIAEVAASYGSPGKERRYKNAAGVEIAVQVATTGSSKSAIDLDRQKNPDYFDNTGKSIKPAEIPNDKMYAFYTTIDPASGRSGKVLLGIYDKTRQGQADVITDLRNFGAITPTPPK